MYFSKSLIIALIQAFTLQAVFAQVIIPSGIGRGCGCGCAETLVQNIIPNQLLLNALAPGIISGPRLISGPGCLNPPNLIPTGPNVISAGPNIISAGPNVLSAGPNIISERYPVQPTTIIQDSTVANNLANALQLLVVSNLLSNTLPLGPEVVVPGVPACGCGAGIAPGYYL